MHGDNELERAGGGEGDRMRRSATGWSRTSRWWKEETANGRVGQVVILREEETGRRPSLYAARARKNDSALETENEWIGTRHRRNSSCETRHSA